MEKYHHHEFVCVSDNTEETNDEDELDDNGIKCNIHI
jgi:hypothetical protein